MADISAAFYVISVEGVAQAKYTGLTGISSEIEPVTGTAGTARGFGTASPPTVTLTRNADGSTYAWAWHQAALAGDPTARRTCTLAMQDAAGEPLMTYVLENAWPGKIDIAGMKAGASEVVIETIELVCDSILMQ